MFKKLVEALAARQSTILDRDNLDVTFHTECLVGQAVDILQADQL